LVSRLYDSSGFHSSVRDDFDRQGSDAKSLGKLDRRFGKKCRFHLQGFKVILHGLQNLEDEVVAFLRNVGEPLTQRRSVTSWKNRIFVSLLYITV